MRIWLAIGLAVAAASLVAGVIPVRRDLRSLRRFSGDAQSAAKQGTFRQPVSRGRVVGFCLALSLIQWLIFTLATSALPMTYAMKMPRGSMVMLMTPAIPLVPLCLFIGIVGGVILAFCERKIKHIAAIVAALARVLFDASPTFARVPVSAGRPPLSRLLGPALFSRPPPRLSPS
jgi:hypothetical protein